MNWRIPVVVTIAWSFAAGTAFAAQVKGVIKSVSPVFRTVAIDGITYAFPPTADIAGLAPGQTVTITFEVAGGTNLVSKVTKWADDARYRPRWVRGDVCQLPAAAAAARRRATSLSTLAHQRADRALSAQSAAKRPGLPPSP